MDVTQLRTAYNDAVQRMNAAADAIASADDTIEAVRLDELAATFDTAKTDVERSKRALDRAADIVEARSAFPVIESPADESRATPPVSHAAPSVSLGKQERTYRPDVARSFFGDVIKASRGDSSAAERLHRNNQEQRDTTTTITSSDGGYIPPGYLGELYALTARGGRPFANALPRLPLPSTGMSFAVPRDTTGVTAAVMATENSAISETDRVSTQLDVPVVTIAGLQDVSMQLFDRSEPGIDMIVFADLQNAYDAALDTQLLAGTGANGQHLGVRAVTSINTVSYSTDSSDTAAELLPKIYYAIEQVHSNRLLPPTHIVMHPRRAAFLAAGLSSTFPLFQQGTLYQGVGSQNTGIIGSLAGIPVIADPNIATTRGTSTNEDEVYVVRVDDMPLMEGALQADVFRDVGSATGTIRLRLFAYSAFVSGRYPKSITKLSGTALSTVLS
jgi:HK97 family phage major capsid protein